MEASLWPPDDQSLVRRPPRRKPTQISQLLSSIPPAIHHELRPQISPAIASNGNASATNTEVSSLESSVFPPATTNNVTEPSSRTSSTEIPRTQSDAFREPLILPNTKGSTIFVYPYSASDIGDDHHERYRAVVEIFKQNVENHERLKAHVSEIDYLLKKCGTSPKESYPSIIVCCTDRIYRDLNKLLTSRHLTKQYYLPGLGWLERWRNGAQQANADAYIPRFKIYFWRGTPHRTLLWRSGLTREIQVQQPNDTSSSPWSNLTMCGSKITSSDGSCSTLACLIEIDSTVYGVTVGHAFAHLMKHVPREDKTLADGNRDPGISNELQNELDSEDDDWAVDDIEYESPEEDDIPSNAAGIAPVANSDAGQNYGSPRLGQEGHGSTVLHLVDTGGLNIPDRDWALVEISGAQSKKPNFYVSAEAPQRPRLLHQIARQHPGHEREVLVIRSLRDIRRGTLLRESSFLGGINRPGICEVWNVAFSGTHGLIKGDSGSLVIDRETNEIYGYVIGLSLLGEVYIMPMAATLVQIKDTLGADYVLLPDPRLLLKNMPERSMIDPSMSPPLPALDNFQSRILAREPVLTHFELEPENTEPDWRPDWYLREIPIRIDAESNSSHSDIPFITQEGGAVFAEIEPNEWWPREWGFEMIDQKQDTNIVVFVPDNFNWPKYHKHRFDEMFWEILNSDINGAFHCEYSATDSIVPAKVSWACFKIKEVRDAMDYTWRQPCIHVEWDCKTGRQLIHVFNALGYKALNDAKEFLDLVSDFEERRYNPFIWHRIFAGCILERYDNAYWLLRDLVRKQEKKRAESKHETSFPLLHDTARHLLHYRETVEVAEHTLQALVTEHEQWRREDSEQLQDNLILKSWLKTRQGLLFEAKKAHSLKMRLNTLTQRNANEINLAFNLVSQISSRTASSATTMMKLFAVSAMIYLPGIFVSGIFSMNFFTFQSSTFTASSSLWIYWAITIPLTTITVLIFAAWHYSERIREAFFFLRFGRRKMHKMNQTLEYPGGDRKYPSTSV